MLQLTTELVSQLTLLQLENLHPPVEGLPRISQSKHGYSELLYAHLLDGEGQRLTYTHFTAKVEQNNKSNLFIVYPPAG